MLFNSLPFFIFFPIFFVVYFATRGVTRLWVTLIASYVFYGWWDIRFLALVWTTTLVDYSIGLAIHHASTEERRRRLLILSVAVNLGLLGFFKYFNFFVDSFADLGESMGLHFSHSLLAIALPVGISFYTFKSLSYTIDVYRRTLEPERSLLRFSVFVAFWPELVSGPIVRGSEFLPQLQSDRRATRDDLYAGLAQITRGFVRKLVIADTLAAVVDTTFIEPRIQSSISLVVASCFFVYQIYNDFAGYTDIAIGLARVLGYRFPQNFDRPYASQTMTEFWRRWHMTLSRWLRDYLYIPLGGNRGGRLQGYRNVMITMLLGGLWHGAGWTFVVWGGLQGVYLVGERALGVADTTARTVAGVYTRRVIVFSLWVFSMIFFRMASLADAGAVLQGILHIGTLKPAYLASQFATLKGLGVIGLSMLIDWGSVNRGVVDAYRRSAAVRYGVVAMSVWVILFLGVFGSNSFIYFQF